MLRSTTATAADNQRGTKMLKCSLCGTDERTNGTIWRDENAMIACEDCREELRVLAAQEREEFGLPPVAPKRRVKRPAVNRRFERMMGTALAGGSLADMDRALRGR